MAVTIHFEKLLIQALSPSDEERSPRFLGAAGAPEPKRDAHGFKAFRDFTFPILERFQSVGKFMARECSAVSVERHWLVTEFKG